MGTTKKTSPKAKAGKLSEVDNYNNDLYWIGIGASAGGLEALKNFVSNIPKANSRKVTYIVAQHLSPKHQSMLVQLVGRETTLKVQELEDETTPEANIMYVTPPNSDVFVENGVLQLREPISEYSPKPSVDLFFTSMAENIGDKAIGVVLSGTGSDGSHGVRAIRAAGGIVVCQDPDTAKYDGMPNNVIDTGCADLVLPPEKILTEIDKVLSSPRELHPVSEEDESKSSIENLLYLLKNSSGIDFKEYKTGTLFRRINRRINACSAESLEGYLKYIESEPKEIELLFKDIMISVTSFFRDKEAFAEVKKVIQDTVKAKEDGSSIRIWIPGCATGEEAYSIAILFAEAAGGLAQLTQKFNFQIFATDIDVDALNRARKGIYPQAIFVNMDKSIKDKYFRLKDQNYEILKPLRDAIVFSKHNVFDDPPFLRMDLIACRNLLIYFNSKLQHNVLSLFHYALTQSGVLFLGKSEALGQSAKFFQAIDTTNKIYKRKIVTSSGSEPYVNTGYANIKKPEITASASTPAKILHDFPDAVVSALSPDSILIDENMDIIRVYGDVQAYTQLSPGNASMNLITLARKEFRQELRALIYKILREDSSRSLLPKKLDINGKIHKVNILIRPLRLKNSPERLLLVSFEKVNIVSSPNQAQGGNNDDSPIVAELEQELVATREHLQTVVEELETSNEELQSTNEEMQSTNEELQSSNEQLETSNEELQSTNEELLTVNEELQVKTVELTTTYEYLHNVKDSIDYPILVVDKDLKISVYNKAVNDVFLLSEDSEGDALTSVVTAIDIPNLRKNVLNVIKKGKIFIRQLDEDDISYIERIIPYRDHDNKIKGAVLTYVNNTEQRLIEKQLEESEERFDLAVRGSNAGIWDWNIKDDEMYWSPSIIKMLGLKQIKRSFKFKDFEKKIHDNDIEDVMSILDAHLTRGFEFNVEFAMEKEDGTYIWVHMRGQAEWSDKKKPYRMAGSIYDVSERKLAIEQLTESNQSLERFAYVCSHDLKEPARVVENFSDLLMLQYGDEMDVKAKKYLAHIQNGGKYMQQMIKDILSYSQLEHKTTSHYQSVNCEEEIEKVLENLKLAIDETGAEINYKDLPSIKADKMQLFQLFQNLIGNALKFCKDKKPSIHVIAEDKGNEWQFTISDNGIGMKKEHASRIFGVFQRLNNKEDYPGTGIGLSICQKIVQKHNGKIWVKSSPNKGSNFYFTIPKKLTKRGSKNVY